MGYLLLNFDPEYILVVNYALEQEMPLSPHKFTWLQEREYKEALEAFNEKNKEKAQLVSKLVEVINHHISSYKLD